jgi:AraC-like DNA-binding protein
MSKAPPRHTIAIGWVSGPADDRRLPRVFGMGCARYGDGEALDHRNDHDQLCLIDEGDAEVSLEGSTVRLSAGGLAIVRAGERFSVGPVGRRPTLLWSIYFFGDPAMRSDCPGLWAAEPARRLLKLDRSRDGEFHGWFERLFLELHARRPGYAVASRNLLGLLLVAISRWITAPAEESPPSIADPEVLALWRLIAEHAESPAALQAALRSRVASYDSLRHRFRRVVGETPRALLARLRMERAKRMLLESALPISAIAESVGYSRQHEFARAFRREVGCTPTWWRERAGDPRQR